MGPEISSTLWVYLTAGSKYVSNDGSFVVYIDNGASLVSLGKAMQVNLQLALGWTRPLRPYRTWFARVTWDVGGRGWPLQVQYIDRRCHVPRCRIRIEPN